MLVDVERLRDDLRSEARCDGDCKKQHDGYDREAAALHGVVQRLDGILRGVAMRPTTKPQLPLSHCATCDAFAQLPPMLGLLALVDHVASDAECFDGGDIGCAFCGVDPGEAHKSNCLGLLLRAALARLR